MSDPASSDDTVDLYGYRYSVYAWIARLALHEKGVAYDWIEIDPFAENIDAAYLALHPFGRVPTLVDDGFALYETGAITRYIDEAFDGPALQPSGARDRARVNQVVSIIDSYAYWPLVRQVFSHAVFHPRTGSVSDPAEIARGLTAADRVLDALERLAGDADGLLGGGLTLADIHLAPIVSYFREAAEGQAALDRRPRLRAWFEAVAARTAFNETKPALSTVTAD